ncbi:MAG: DUF4328 domain-containing protein [Hyphomonadaceae bacterium]|nr:DUF4328 domain-containing protein [Hyphomonadaceae bacterium]
MSDTPATPPAGAPDDLFAKTAAPGAPFRWSPQARPMRGLHAWLRGSLIFYAVMEGLQIPVSAFELWSYEAASGWNESQVEAYSLVSSMGSVGISGIGVIVAIVAAVMFLRFLYRGLKNLHLSNANGELMGPGWAVAYCFIPIVSLWKPHQAMRQVWRSSHDPVRAFASPPGTMWAWWLPYLFSNWIGNLSFRLSIQAGGFGEITDPDLYMSTYWLDIAGAVLMIVSIIFLIPIVRQITTAQDRLADASAF